MDLPEKIMKKLQCSQCKEALSVLPVYSYENGEIVCGRCPLISDQKPSKDHCFELIAVEVNFPCIYKSYGCVETLTPAELLLHEPACLYKQWYCPHITENCTWQGMLDELMAHYEDEHEGFILEEMDRYPLENNAENWEGNYLLNAVHETFLVQFKKTSEQLFANVCFMGPRKASQFYNYSISIYSRENEDSLELPKQKVQVNNGNNHIDQLSAYVLDLQLLDGFTEMECEVLITRDKKFIKESEKLSDLNEYILKHIECPICFEYMTSPIYQCSNSHTICEKCKAKTPTCPSCRVPIGTMRNRPLEEITENVLYNCRYEGCGCVYKYQEKREHESNCEFAPYDCPFACEYKSQYSELFTHVKTVHFEDFLQNNTVNVYFESIEAEIYVLRKDSSLFILSHYLLGNDFCVNVTHQGPKVIPNNFYFVYDMHSENKKLRINIQAKCLDKNSDRTVSCVRLPLLLLESFKKDFYFTYSINIIEDC